VAAYIVQINRAPVLALWAAVVTERLGLDRDEALAMGKVVTGLNAQSKGRRPLIRRGAQEERHDAGGSRMTMIATNTLMYSVRVSPTRPGRNQWE
jgi:hypothetical protein